MTKDRNRKPELPTRLEIRSVSISLRLVVILTSVVLVLFWPKPASGELTVEHRAGSVRVWTQATGPISIRLADDLRPQTAVVAEGGIVLAGEDRPSGDLFFLRQTAGATIRLPSPSSRVAPLRTHPVLLAGDQHLAGSVWLEGTNQQDFAVRASSWNGTSWEAVEIVAKGGAGPQLAPTATLLEDGSWMVLWAGFDGSDDEIFWCRRVDGIWSHPRRLHGDNRVPDILPAVSTDAAGQGAYAAWSTFDGNDYRVRTARWDGSSWITGPALPGRGAIRAGFETADGRNFLTYSSVEPQAWHLVETHPTGSRMLGSASQSHAERPLIVLKPQSAPTLAWPWRIGDPRQ